MQIWAVLGIRERFDYRMVFWKRRILVFKEVHFPESIISKIFRPSRWSFFLKCVKFHVDLKNALKISEIIFGFQDNRVWTGCVIFSHLWTEYMWSNVNVLTNSLYILDVIHRDVFQLNLSLINGKLGQKRFRGDLSSAWDPRTLWFLKCVLKQEVLPFKEAHLSEPITSKIFEPSSWSFFSKCANFHVDFKNATKISEIAFGF